MNLRQVTTPKGVRYYVDGRRVSADAFAAVKIGRRLDCFRTVTKGETVRQLCEARDFPKM